MTNILQANLLVDFLYPFLLMFFISFALLEKSKLLGEEKQQINAFVSLVIGLIFVSAAGYVGFASDLILFMTIGLVVLFVGFMFWGFVSGGTTLDAGVKTFLGVLIFISLIITILVSTGIFGSVWNFIETIFNWMFHSNGSEGFWTNLIIVGLVVAAVSAVLRAKGAVTGEGN